MVIRVPDQRKTPGGYAALDDRLLVLDFQAGNPQAFVEIHRGTGPWPATSVSASCPSNRT